MPGVGAAGDERASRRSSAPTASGCRRRTRRRSSSPSSRRGWRRCSCPTSQVTTWIDISDDRSSASGTRSSKHVTQIVAGLPVHEARPRRLARVLGPRGVRPARVAGRDGASPRRTSSPASERWSGAPGGRSASPALAGRAAPTRLPGSRPFDASKIWPMTTRPSPAGSRKFGWALSRMMCGRIRAWTSVGAAERQLERDPLHRRLGPGLVEDEVAERVPDRLALVDLHRARPVGVVADDHVGAGVDRRPGPAPAGP